jgi:hypothetical protein
VPQNITGANQSKDDRERVALPNDHRRIPPVIADECANEVMSTRRNARQHEIPLPVCEGLTLQFPQHGEATLDWGVIEILDPSPNGGPVRRVGTPTPLGHKRRGEQEEQYGKPYHGTQLMPQGCALQPDHEALAVTPPAVPSWE